MSVTLCATSAARKSAGAGIWADNRASPAAMPSALSSAIAARLDSRMRSRMGAALVAMALGGRCGFFQDSFHPLDALLDLVDGVGVGQPQICLAFLAERAPGKQGHTALVEHPVGELSLVLAGLGDVREHIESTERLVAAH